MFKTRKSKIQKLQKNTCFSWEPHEIDENGIEAGKDRWLTPYWRESGVPPVWEKSPASPLVVVVIA